jgi:aminoglycoside phosphotransferase (APT) family kinase protein
VERNWERARPFAEPSIEEMENRVGVFFPGARVLAADRQTRGLRNSNYRLTVAGAPSPLALRLYVADPAACAREAAVIAALSGRIPAPRMLGSDTVADPPFALLEWLDGEPLDDVLRDCDVAAALNLAAGCGTVLAAIHETRFPAPGFLGPDLSVERPMPRWAPTVRATLDGPAGGRLGPELAARVRKLVEANARAVEVVWAEAVLTHADFKPWNLLTRQEEGAWRICGVLDWEFACAASPLLDFAIFLRDERSRPAGFGDALAAAYCAAGGSLPDGWRRLARLIDLLNMLQLLEWSGKAAVADLRGLVSEALDTVEP